MIWLIVVLLVLNLVATVALFVWVRWQHEDTRNDLTELGRALRVFR